MKKQENEKILRIREVLEECGATPQYLADCMGVSRQYINNVLSERGAVSVRILRRIAIIMRVPLASLFADYNAPFDKSKPFKCPHCHADLRVGENTKSGSEPAGCR